MKDALGHGSDAKGGAPKTEKEKNAEFSQQLRGWFAGDKQAAQALASKYGNKSVSVEIHRAQTPEMKPKTVPMIPGTQSEYNRDLALRIKNGQVGSGMKFRG